MERFLCWRLLVTILLTLSLGCFADEVDDLIGKLKDLDPGERQSAAIRLAYGSQASAKVLAALLETLRTDPELSVQDAAVSAIGELAGTATPQAPYLEALRGLLSHDSPRLALTAAVALEGLRDGASEATRLALYKKAVTAESEQRSAAILGLAKSQGKESFALLKGLLEVLPLDQEVAGALYDKPGSVGKDLVVDRIARGLKTAEGEDFEAALSLVQQLPSGNDGLVSQVEELARTSNDTRNRISLFQLLYRWDPVAARLAPLAQILSTPEGATSEAISQVVGSADTKALKSLRGPLLRLLSTTKDADALSLLIDATAMPGAGEKEVLTGLLANKAHSSPLVRAKVAKSVSSLGPAAVGAVPALRELMKDSELEVAVIAAASYYKLTADRAPVLEVYRKAASTEAGIMALFNHLDSEALSLGDDLFGTVLPQAMAGDSTAQRIVLALIERARPERLGAILNLYQSLDSDVRSSFLYTLNSTHVARPQVYDFLVKVAQTGEFEEAIIAAQLLREKAGDSEPLVSLLRKFLVSGTSDEKRIAVGKMASDEELCSVLGAEMLAVLPTISEDFERAYLLQGLYSCQPEVALQALVENLREQRYGVLANFVHDSDMMSKIGQKLGAKDFESLNSYLIEYRKNPRRWDDDLRNAALACGLLQFVGARNAPAVEALSWLATNHPSQTLRSYASKAVGGTDAP